jgi:hypothetical protein
VAKPKSPLERVDSPCDGPGQGNTLQVKVSLAVQGGLVSGPVRVGKPWQMRMIRALGHRLEPGASNQGSDRQKREHSQDDPV